MGLLIEWKLAEVHHVAEPCHPVRRPCVLQDSKDVVPDVGIYQLLRMARVIGLQVKPGPTLDESKNRRVKWWAQINQMLTSVNQIFPLPHTTHSYSNYPITIRGRQLMASKTAPWRGSCGCSPRCVAACHPEPGRDHVANVWSSIACRWWSLSQFVIDAHGTSGVIWLLANLYIISCMYIYR